ncbi:glycosyltransferase family 2 protein [Chloroflexota bacterium]
MNMLSVVIPAHNEQQAIAGVLEELKATLDEVGQPYEVIVVDDGSTDDTAAIVQEKGGVRLIQHPYNRGYGASLKTGILKAAGDIILTFDADGSYKARDIPKLMEQAEDYDMVVGARTGKEVKIPPYRKPAKWFLTKLASYLSRTKIPDLNAGMRLFKKVDVEQFMGILPSSFSFTTTLTLAYLCNDYLVKYVSVDCYERVGKSKIKPVRDGLNFILLILRVITYFNPLRVFLPVALGLLATALIVLFGSLMLLGGILDATVVALFVAGIQIGALGLLADAIARRREMK